MYTGVMRKMGYYFGNYLKVYFSVIGTSTFVGPTLMYLLTQHKDSFDLYGLTLFYGLFYSWVGLMIVAFVDVLIRLFKWNSMLSRCLGGIILLFIAMLGIAYSSRRVDSYEYLFLPIYFGFMGGLMGFFHYRFVGLVSKQEES